MLRQNVAPSKCKLGVSHCRELVLCLCWSITAYKRLGYQFCSSIAKTQSTAWFQLCPPLGVSLNCIACKKKKKKSILSTLFLHFLQEENPQKHINHMLLFSQKTCLKMYFLFLCSYESVKNLTNCWCHFQKYVDRETYYRLTILFICSYDSIQECLTNPV